MNNREYTRLHQRWIRRTTVPAVLLLFFTFVLPPGLLAQTFQRYDERSKDGVEKYVDRAHKLDTEQAWNNYVQLGIAAERVEWENEAFAQLQDQLKVIDDSGVSDADKEAQKQTARAAYQSALAAWELDASDHMLRTRGEFLAELDTRNILLDEITDAEYSQILERITADTASHTVLSLNDFDTALNALHTPYVTEYETSLTNALTTAQGRAGGLTGVELAAFNQKLTDIETELRAEFETRDSFYTKRARNRYTSRIRADDASAKLLSQADAANTAGDEIIRSALSDIGDQTDSLIQKALADMQGLIDGPDVNGADIAGTDWERKMQAVIDSGLRKWELAEDELYRKRLLWQNEAKASRVQADKVWQANHDKLKQAMDQWLETARRQILDGRSEWEQKFQEFRDGRDKAQQELAEYIQRQREQWTAGSQQLGDIIQGGGGALLQAKDASRYYENLLVQKGWRDPNTCATLGADDKSVCDFYHGQLTSMTTAVNRFQQSLIGAETQLGDLLHSDSDSSGLLKDKRVYAGDIPDQVALLSESGFKTAFAAFMAGRAEDFVLYRRDMEHLADRNDLFVTLLKELKDSAEFTPAGASDLTALNDQVGKLDARFDEHRGEILAIINKDRDAALTDAEKLAAIKTEIADLLANANDGDYADKRLKQKVLAYFNEGLSGKYIEPASSAGYYQTDKQNDPYLMTRAEYEWELLRRERNYLASRLRRAEEVKRYAELAEKYQAGLEMAAVTQERAKAAELHTQLRELAYLLAKGDLALDPNVFLNDATGAAARVAERTRLYGERGIDLNAANTRVAALGVEIDIAGRMAAAGAPDVAGTTAFLDEINAHLAANVAGSTPEETEKLRNEHPLGGLRLKLQEYRNLIQGGASAQSASDRWTLIAGAAGAVAGELGGVRDEYDVAKLTALHGELLTVMQASNLALTRTQLENKKNAIEANATALRTARQELDLAKAAYEQAYKDFRILIQSQDAAGLIAAEITGATGELAAVLHRMAKIENIDGFSGVYSPAELKRLEYLNEIGQGDRAGKDLQRADSMLQFVEGLEASKARRATLEGLVGAGGFPPADAKTLADVFLDQRGTLLDESGGAEHMRSSARAVQAMNILAGAKSALETARTELATKQADASATPVELELARKAVSDSEEGVLRAVETLVAALRGETAGRRTVLLDVLEQKDGGGNPVADYDQLVSQLDADGKNLNEQAYELSERTAVRLHDFLAGNRDKSFAELLQQVNGHVAGAARNLNTAYTGHGAAGATAPGEHGEWLLVRGWLAANRALVDKTNEAPGALDPRTTAEKWNELVRLAGDLKDDSSFHRTFEGNIPDAANHAWVTTYRTERQALLGRLNGVLGAAPADVYTQYQALGANDRDILETYGVVDALNPAGTLDAIRMALQNELAGLSANYRAVYLREQAVVQQRELDVLSPQLNRKSADLDAARLEKARLETDKAALTTERAGAVPARRAEIDVRLAQIDARTAELVAQIAGLEPDVETLGTRARAAANALREATSPGSTAPFFAAAMSLMGTHATGVEELRRTVSSMAAVRRERSLADTTASTTAVDRVKAIMGFYETDRDGEIRRDPNGHAIVSAEFQTLGLAHDADIGQLLNGERTGPQLERWAERLGLWMLDRKRAEQAPAEVRAAVNLLEESIRKYLAAKLFIDESRAGTSAADMQTDARAQLARAQGLMEKLAQVVSFESGLEQAMTQARESGGDAADAALAFLEKPENVRTLYLFQGFDRDGAPDGVVDGAIQQRVDEIRLLADRIRESRLRRALALAGADYASLQANNLILIGDTDAVLPTSAEFKATRARLDGTALIGEIGGLGDTGLRAALFARLSSGGPNEVLFLSELAGVLGRDGRDGADLKTAVLGALNTLQTRIDGTVDGYLAGTDGKISRERDLRTTETAAGLIAAYAARGDAARANYLPLIAAIAPGAAAADARDTMLNEMSTQLDGAVFTTMRSEIRRAVNTHYTVYTDEIARIDGSADTPAAKDAAKEAARVKFLADARGEITTLVNGITSPTAQEQADLLAVQYGRDLALVTAVADTADTYDADDYPQELREFTLLRQYARAQERYDEFLRLKNSSVQAERERASLNLTGIMGDYGRRILRLDLEAYMSANDPAAYMSAGNRSVAGYLGEYLRDRGTDGTLLPDGGALLLEMATHAEYLRIQAAATAAGGLHKLDESKFAAEFRSYIFLSATKHYIDTNTITLAGATVADRQAEFRTHFESMLADANHAVGGKTIGERFPGTSERDGLFAQAFAFVETGAAAAGYLPSVLDERRTDGTLDQAFDTADDFLPDELKVIAGYNVNPGDKYRAAARGVHKETERELARLEIIRRAGLEDLSPALTNAEIDDIIARAGHPALPADIHTEMVVLLRNVNQAARGGASTAKQAVALLRSRTALESFFGTRAEREELQRFYTAQGEKLPAAEAKFFLELRKTSSELREAAKLNRGAFFRALIELERGGQTAYFNSLAPALRTELTALKDVLFSTGQDKFTPEERTALLGDALMYEKAFELRSAQELAVSGIFEGAEQTVFGVLARAGSDALLSAARDSRNAVVRDFIALVQHLADNDDDATGYAPASGIAGLKDALVKAAASMSPDFRDVLVKDRVMVNRFLSTLLETDAERKRLEDLLRDPALLDPRADLALDYAADRELALIAHEGRDLSAAVAGFSSEHLRYFEERNRGLTREAELAGELLKFAQARGTDDVNFTSSRFGNYRTFIGAQWEVQQQQYLTYLQSLTPSPAITAYITAVQGSLDPAGWPAPPANVRTLDDYLSGGTLHATVLNGGDPQTLLLSANWQDLLTSDDLDASAADVLLQNDLGNPGDDVNARLRGVKTVTPFASLRGGTPEDSTRNAYYANLANNYLETVTGLNRALRAVFSAAKLADQPSAAAGDLVPAFKNDREFNEYIKTQYDATATTAVDLAALRSVKTDAQSRLAAHDLQKASEKLGEFRSMTSAFQKAQTDFAQAGRRQLLQGQKLTDFIDRVFRGPGGVEERFNNAETTVNNLSTTADTLQNEYSVLTSDYTGALNRMADRYRDFRLADENSATKRAVSEFAQTPYLYAGAGDGLQDATVKFGADAVDEYRLALAAYNDAQERMKQAGYNVHTQDQLAEYKGIMTALETGTPAEIAALQNPLDATERTRLTELREKSFKEYLTLAPAEQTELGELARRDMYERYRDLIQARRDHELHTRRMVRVHKASAVVSARIQELRVKVAEKKSAFEDSLNRNFTVRAGFHGKADAHNVQRRVYARLRNVHQSGGSMVDEFRYWYWNFGAWSQSASTTYGGAAQLGQPVSPPQFWPSQVLEAAIGVTYDAGVSPADRDALRAWTTMGDVHAFNHFAGAYTNYIAMLGGRDMAQATNLIVKQIQSVVLTAGYALIATGTSLSATIVGAVAGGPMIVAGRAAVHSALAAMLQSELGLLLANWGTVLAHGAMTESVNANMGGLTETMGAHDEYAAAQQELDYFTKAEDLATLKKRMIEYGTAAQNPDKYELTDADLKYLFENRGGGDEYKDSAGNDMTAAGHAHRVTTADQSDGLNIALRLRPVDNFDQYGELTGTVDAYDMGEILQMTASHGLSMRNARRDTYVSRGNSAADAGFVLRERDDTFASLFAYAGTTSPGGREYAGYGMTYADYQGNADAVFLSELQQRQTVQLTEWTLREKELQDRYDAWEKRMNTVLERGRTAWSQAMDRFRQKRRRWEKEFDADTAKGRKEWEQRVNDHFAKKQAWENGIRKKMQDTTVQNALSGLVTDLNAQISGFASTLGITFESVDRMQVINKTLDEINADLPSKAENLAALNANIRNFKTALAASELSAGDFAKGVGGVSKTFRENMQTFQTDVRILANVRAHEQYLKFVNRLKEQIRRQNEAVARQTASAAYQAGFVKRENQFIKTDGRTPFLGVVDGYVGYDVNEVDRLMKDMGLTTMSGDALTTFLKERSDIEVRTYFETQQLGIQALGKKILGSGTPNERKGSDDAKIVGLLGEWVGRAPNSQIRSAARIATAGANTGIDSELQALTIDALGGGSGELGSSGARVSGAPFGFYVQLAMASRLFNIEQGKSIEEYANAGADAQLSGFDAAAILAGGGLSYAFYGMSAPGMAITNSFSPAALGNAAQNVRIGSEINGIDRGYLLDAQGLNLIKAPLSAGGSLLTAAGASGVGGWWSPAVAALGAALIAASNSIQVNPTTGERKSQLTQKGQAQTALAIGAAAIGGAFSQTSVAVGGGYSVGAGQLASAGSSVLGGGLRTDSSGNIIGYGFGGKEGRARLLRTTAGVVTSVGIGKIPGLEGVSPFTQTVGSSVLNRASAVATEYLIQQSLGAEFSGFRAIQENKDLSGFSALLGGITGVAVQQYVRHVQVESQIAELTAQGHTRNQAMAILLGAAVRRREDYGDADGYQVPLGPQSTAVGGELEEVSRQALNNADTSKVFNSTNAANEAQALAVHLFGDAARSYEVWLEFSKMLSGKSSMRDVMEAVQQRFGFVAAVDRKYITANMRDMKTRNENYLARLARERMNAGSSGDVRFISDFLPQVAIGLDQGIAMDIRAAGGDVRDTTYVIRSREHRAAFQRLAERVALAQRAESLRMRDMQEFTIAGASRPWNTLSGSRLGGNLAGIGFAAGHYAVEAAAFLPNLIRMAANLVSGVQAVSPFTIDANRHTRNIQAHLADKTPEYRAGFLQDYQGMMKNLGALDMGIAVVAPLWLAKNPGAALRPAMRRGTSGVRIYAGGSRTPIGGYNHSADDVTNLLRGSNTRGTSIIDDIDNPKLTGPTLEVLTDARYPTGGIGGRMVPMEIGGQRYSHVKLQRLHNQYDNAVTMNQEARHGIDHITGRLNPGRYASDPYHRFEIELRGHMVQRQWAWQNRQMLEGNLRFHKDIFDPMTVEGFSAKMMGNYGGWHRLRDVSRRNQIIFDTMRDLNINPGIFLP